MNEYAIKTNRTDDDDAINTKTTGNRLIVADFSQLELRVLATLTRCGSMRRAFEAGGDFHSRTAAAMFDNIQKALRENRLVG